MGVCKQFSHQTYKSIILGKYLLQEHYFGNINLKQKKILDLGCGTGVLAIMLAMRGANVLATDLPETEQLIKQNINENQQLITKNQGQCQFASLDWSCNKLKLSETLNSLGFLTNIDFIVASDCIFNTNTFILFPQFLNTLLETLQTENNHKKCQVYLAHRQRHESIDDDFEKTFEQHNLWIKQIDHKQLDSTYRSLNVKVYTLGKF